MKTIPIGTSPAGVRQEILLASQVGGTLPVRTIAGPIIYAEPEPLSYSGGIYEYGEVRKYLVLGDPAVPGGFITLRYLPQSIVTGPADDWKCSIIVLDGAAEGVEVRNAQVIITLNTGVSTYASVYATLVGDALFASKIIAILDGAGGVAAIAQTEQTFYNPSDTPVVLSDGGLFRFGELYPELMAIHLELGAASVVTISVTDADGVSHPRNLNTGVSGAADYYVYPAATVPILPNQCVVITETVNGVPVLINKFITLYAVTGRRR